MWNILARWCFERRSYRLRTGMGWRYSPQMTLSTTTFEMDRLTCQICGSAASSSHRYMIRRSCGVAICFHSRTSIFLSCTRLHRSPEHAKNDIDVNVQPLRQDLSRWFCTRLSLRESFQPLTVVPDSVPNRPQELFL